MRKEAGLEENTTMFGLRVLEQIIENDIQVVSYDRIAATCFYAGCKISNKGLTLADIEKLSRKEADEIASKTKKINREAELGISLTDPLTKVERCCEELPLSTKEVEQIVSFTEEVIDHDGHINKPASTVAASTIHAASKINEIDLSQGDIAETAGTTKVTIRNNYKDILHALNREFPPEILPPESVEDALKLLEGLDVWHAINVERVRNLAKQVENESGEGAHSGAVTAGSLLAVAEGNGRGIKTKPVADAVGASETTAEKHKKKALTILNE